ISFRASGNKPAFRPVSTVNDTTETAMTDTPEDLEAPSRRHLLKCSAWAGTGVAWAMVGGVPRAFALDHHGKARLSGHSVDRFLFVQISDTHIGFNKEAN